MIGKVDFPSQLAGQASQLYSNNISALMMSFGEKGYFNIKYDPSTPNRKSYTLNSHDVLWPLP